MRRIKFTPKNNTLHFTERFIIFHWLHGGYFEIFYYNRKAYYVENAYVDGGSFCVQIVFHYFWNVFARIFLCLGWNNCVRKRQIRRGNWKVIFLFFTDLYCIEYNSIANIIVGEQTSILPFMVLLCYSVS